MSSASEAAGEMKQISQPAAPQLQGKSSSCGTVKEIQLVYTKLMTPDNKVIYVPNNEITASKIVNYTKEDSRRVEVKVTASYDCKTADVKKAINAKCCQCRT